MPFQKAATGNAMASCPSFPKLSIVADASTLIHGRFPRNHEGLDSWVRAGFVRLYVPTSELAALWIYHRSRRVRDKMAHARRWLDELAYCDTMVSIQKESEGFPCSHNGVEGDWWGRQESEVVIPERFRELFSYVLWLAYSGPRDSAREKGPSREIVVLSEDKTVRAVGRLFGIEVYSISELASRKLEHLIDLYRAHAWVGDICVDQQEEQDDDDLESIGNVSEIAARPGRHEEDDNDNDGDDEDEDEDAEHWLAEYYHACGLKPPMSAPNLQLNTAIFTQYDYNASSTTLNSFNTPTLTRTGDSSPVALRKFRTPTTPPPIAKDSGDKVVAKLHQGWVASLRQANRGGPKYTEEGVRVISADDFTRDQPPADAHLWEAHPGFSQTRPADPDFWGYDE